MRRLSSSTVCRLLRLAIPAVLGACGGDDGVTADDIVGVWFACADEACEGLADDGFELADDGHFTSLRLESGDAEDARYCEVPAGSFEFGHGALVLTPAAGQDSREEPRTVDFDVSSDHATLTDERGGSRPYIRVTGSSSGLCVGVLDR